MKAKVLIALSLLASVGCEVLEEDISGTEVSVVAPADRVVLPAGEVAFRWRRLQYASGYEFRAVCPTFENAGHIVADTVIYADSLGRGYGCSLTLEEGDYEWSVTAFNGGYASRTVIRSLRVGSAPEQEP